MKLKQFTLGSLAPLAKAPAMPKAAKIPAPRKGNFLGTLRLKKLPLSKVRVGSGGY